jgi:hypothetical protein
MQFLPKTIQKRQLVALVIPFVLTGCPISEDNNNEEDWIIEEDPEEAKAKCVNLLEWVCTEGEPCLTGMTTSTDCIAAIDTERQCGGAVAVRNSYFDCRSEIYDWDCAEDPLPTSCSTAIVFKGEDTESTGGGGDDSDNTLDTESTGGGGDDSDNTLDAKAMCENIYRTTCEHLVSCALAGGADASAVSTIRTQCLSSSAKAYRCDEVTGPGRNADNYDECIAAIKATDCSASGATAQECEYVLQY